MNTQKPDAVELLPCPFCGAEAKRRDELSKGVEGVVACSDCGAATFASTWNTRDTAERDALKAEVAAGKEQLREFAEDVAYQYAYERNGELTTGGLSTMEYTFRILGWDDPHRLATLEGESK